MNRRKAQSILEYAVILSVVVAGIVAMNTYMKRAAEGKLRESADRIGSQYSAGNTTYKRVTSHPAGMKTQESFGLNESGTVDQGVSYYKVLGTAKTTTSMDSTNGSAPEVINKKVSDEDLF